MCDSQFVDFCSVINEILFLLWTIEKYEILIKQKTVLVMSEWY